MHLLSADHFPYHPVDMAFITIGAVALRQPERVRSLSIARSGETSRVRAAPGSSADEWQVLVRIENEHQVAGIFDNQSSAAALLAAGAKELQLVCLTPSYALRADHVISLQLLSLPNLVDFADGRKKTVYRMKIDTTYGHQEITVDANQETIDHPLGAYAKMLGLTAVSLDCAFCASRIVEIYPKQIWTDRNGHAWQATVVLKSGDNFAIFSFGSCDEFAEAAGAVARLATLVKEATTAQ